MKNSVPLKKESLPDKIFEIIKSMIQSGKWKQGEKIPSENELAKYFDVNRLTVRMAIQKLNTIGLVETKAGEGTYVRKFSLKFFIKEMSDLFITPEMLDDVCEFRKHVELECARLAIKLSDENDIAQLEKVYDTYSHIPHTVNLKCREGIERLVEADLDFHYQIVKMSKNSLYILSFNAVREAIRQYMFNIVTRRMHTFLDSGKMNESGEFIEINGGFDIHKLILNAIIDRDLKTCKRLYIDMIDYKIDDPLPS